jgi:tetratricopeptide (TPR) repeat protein
MLAYVKDNFFNIIAAFALTCSLGANALAQPSLSPQLAKLFTAGVDALKSGDLETAEKTFQEVLRRGGKASFVHHNLGIVYQQRGDHAKAAVQFREAVRLQPNFGQARLLLGVSLLASGKIAEAAGELEHSVRLLPGEPQSRLQLANAYERANNWLGAVAQYQALRELAPQEAEYAYRLGRAYARLSEWSLDQIIKIDPEAARLRQSLGQQLLMQGKYELAASEYRRAAERDPKLPEIHLALALIYLEQKRFDEALKEIEQELKITPQSRKALELKQKIDTAKSASSQ